MLGDALDVRSLYHELQGDRKRNIDGNWYWVPSDDSAMQRWANQGSQIPFNPVPAETIKNLGEGNARDLAADALQDLVLRKLFKCVEKVCPNADDRLGFANRRTKPAAPGAITPRNAHLAGKTHPKTGIPFDDQGYPDFSGVATKTVNIKQTGNRAGDFAAANQAAGLGRTPEGFTWHHHQDGTTMQLVPTPIHAQTGHTGGFTSDP